MNDAELVEKFGKVIGDKLTTDECGLLTKLFTVQTNRIAKLERERKEFQEFEHTCSGCGREAKNTIRRTIFEEVRTQCEVCGKWWSTYTKHPNEELAAERVKSLKKKKP